MPQPIPFPQATHLLKGGGKVSDLHVHVDGEYVLSKWAFTKPELEEIYHTGHVWAWVKTCGSPAQPISLLARSPFSKAELPKAKAPSPKSGG